MSVKIERGQKADITKGNEKLHCVDVAFDWAVEKDKNLDIDISAFLLQQDGKVAADEDFIFYGNLNHASDCATYRSDNLYARCEKIKNYISIDIEKIPSNISRIAITLTIYDGDYSPYNFSMVKNLRVTLYDRISNCELLQFAFGDNFTAENAVVVCEVYRYKGEWKFNAVGSGFFGGLAALCNNFGIDVIEQTDTDRTPPQTLETEKSLNATVINAVEQKTEKISLKKGQKVSLTKKADSSPILVENGWTASGKDYDLKALVRYRNGKQIYIGAANDDELLETPEGAVRHCGDVTEAGEMEKIIIKWHPDIASVALSSYSAIENGFGSFRQYGVFVRITNGKQVIEIPAQSTSAKWFSYTLCFGEVIFGKDKNSFDVSALEMYSRFMSENRIGYRGDKVVMDIGPIGKFKNNFFSNLFGTN